MITNSHPHPAGPIALGVLLLEGDLTGTREIHAPSSPLFVVAGPLALRDRLLDRLGNDVSRYVVYVMIGRDRDGRPIAYVGRTGDGPGRFPRHVRDPRKDGFTELFILAGPPETLSLGLTAALEHALALHVQGLGAVRLCYGRLPEQPALDDGDRLTLVSLLNDARRLLATALCAAFIPLPAPARPDPGPVRLEKGFTLTLGPGVIDSPAARRFVLAEGAGLRAEALVVGQWRVLLPGSQVRRTARVGAQRCIERKRRALLQCGVLRRDPHRPDLLVVHRPVALPSLLNAARIVRGDNARGMLWRPA